MGKSIPTKTGLRAASKAASSSFKLIKPSKPTRSVVSSNLRSGKTVDGGCSDASGQASGNNTLRLPLSAVVADCAKRWFKETLQEAKAGDTGMQVLVGQMYYSGYGVPRDAKKGRIWMTRASKIRTSVWSVRDKRPGYNASDSDSD